MALHHMEFQLLGEHDGRQIEKKKSRLVASQRDTGEKYGRIKQYKQCKLRPPFGSVL
jgi:hypothetical protein